MLLLEAFNRLLELPKRYDCAVLRYCNGELAVVLSERSLASDLSLQSLVLDFQLGQPLHKLLAAGRHRRRRNIQVLIDILRILQGLLLYGRDRRIQSYCLFLIGWNLFDLILLREELKPLGAGWCLVFFFFLLGAWRELAGARRRPHFVRMLGANAKCRHLLDIDLSFVFLVILGI